MNNLSNLKDAVGTILSADKNFQYLFSTNFGYNSWKDGDKVATAANEYWGDAYHIAEYTVNDARNVTENTRPEDFANYVLFMLFFQAGLNKMFEATKDYKYALGASEGSLNDIGSKYCIMYNKGLREITFKIWVKGKLSETKPSVKFTIDLPKYDIMTNWSAWTSVEATTKIVGYDGASKVGQSTQSWTIKDFTKVNIQNILDGIF